MTRLEMALPSPKLPPCPRPAWCWLAATSLLALVGPASQAAGKDEPGPRMLYAHLLGQAQKHFDARRQAVAALKTPEDVRRRQKELRQRFVAALGGFPERTPLNARVVGKIDGDGYRVERVVYESRPDHHVTALFYLPAGKPPFPGVLMPCGHSANGKAAEAYQRACILMAKNGLVVLCYDPIGQGERSQLLDRQGKPAIAGSTSEHTMAGIGALLVGRNTATYRIWDGVRSLDYLAGRPEVDPKRLGCTGNSGGGTLTSYLMALDDRIVAAAPSCYITSLERLFATIGPQDAEQNITGQVAFGMEHADYVTMRAPRPALICTGTQDFFDIQGSWTTFREAKRVYGLMGHGERVDLFEYDDKHGFSKPRREAALRWMRRWLLGKDDAPTEGDFSVRKDAELQCTRTGQVLEDFKGRSVFDLNRAVAAELAKKRERFLASAPADELRKEVRRLIRLPSPAKTGVPTLHTGEEKRDGYTIRRFRHTTEEGVAVGAWSFTPEKKAVDAELVVYLHPRGNGADADPGGPIERIVKSGRPVLALELRGTGLTSPRLSGTGWPAPFGPDSREAFLSLHLDRPLLGQRVFDLLRALQARLGFGEVHLVGVGRCGPVALHAAALEPRVTRLTLDGAVVSWSSVVATPRSVDQLANVVPGALAVYDLPDLATLVAPRPLTIRNPVDAAGKPLSRDECERAYAACRTAYKDKGAEKALRLLD
jgi:dienelactone hydrolase/pimeloyl-ACP methyl ester carboxylesterase